MQSPVAASCRHLVQHLQGHKHLRDNGLNEAQMTVSNDLIQQFLFCFVFTIKDANSPLSIHHVLSMEQESKADKHLKMREICTGDWH